MNKREDEKDFIYTRFGWRDYNMPPRKNQYQYMTLRDAILSLASDTPQHIDILANNIWQLSDHAELARVKTSLASMLSKLRRQGLLVKEDKSLWRRA